MAIKSAVSKKIKMQQGIFKFLLVVLVCSLLIFSASTMENSYSASINDVSSDVSTKSLISLLLPSFDSIENAKRLKLWRQSIRDQCQAAASKSDMKTISVNQISGFDMPNYPIPQVHSSDNAVQRCRNVVMDFGANIGDTSGHVIDAGMISCDRQTDLNDATQSSHFNIEKKRIRASTTSQ
jgi:hypothetical protein